MPRRVGTLLLGMSPVLLALSFAAVAAPKPSVRLVDGFPETRPDRLFGLDEVRRGQRGIGYTVFAADAAEPFEVEILGVMEGMLGPDQSVILARLSGEKIERTGVIAGMSGSPVYIDGRLVGAVAYRFGAFTAEPIAGITPIRDMLEMQKGADGRASAPPLFRGPLPALGDPADPSRARLPPLPAPPRPVGAAGRFGAATPIATPLVISGLDPAVLEARRPELEAAGFLPVAGGGRSQDLDLGLFEPRPSAARTVAANTAGEAGRVKAAPIAPASPIGALLMRGDINVAAIGTVTYVEGDRVLAFGHPFIGHGEVAFPMTTAAIVNTLASEAGSYKQGLPAREVGVIRQDRLTAIGGALGAAAPMIPVRILIQGLDDPAASVGIETRVEIVDDPVWFPAMLDNAIASAASRRLGYEAGGTLDLDVRIHVEDRVLAYEDRLSAPPPLRLPAFASRDVASSAAMLLRNELKRAPIHGVEVRLRVSAEVHLTELLRVDAPARARPGETIAAAAVVRPYRGAPRRVPFELRVPDDAVGEVELYVGGGLELDRKDGDARGRRTPKDLDDLMALLAARRPAQALYARLYLPQPGLTHDMAVMTALPPSARATLTAQPRDGLEASEARPGPEARIPLERVLSGAQSVTIEVVP